MIRIYKDQGKYQEALAILEDPQTGFASSIGERSWELAIQITELQGLSGKWELQWQNCQSILRDACPNIIDREITGLEFAFGERGDDWKVWKMFVISAGHLVSSQPRFVNRPCSKSLAHDRSILDRTEQLFIDFARTRSRNASLAQLMLYSQVISDPSSKKLFKRCQKYFEDYSNKVACFQDIHPHLAGLSRTHQEMLISNLTRQSKDRRRSTVSDQVSHMYL